jgi:ADP-ribose pyrophosphatase
MMNNNTNAELVTLYRPTGINELKLIHDSGMKAFPPRLPEQPIFYPVMNQGYADQIARDWNAVSEPNRIGFVLSFCVPKTYLSKYPVQVVGGRQHQELWVPAEDLEEFNRQIVGQIEICEVFRGPGCAVEIDEATKLPIEWVKPQILHEGRFLRLVSDKTWEYVERRNVSGVVAILAITEENKVLMIEQYRPSIRRMVVEVPAGLAGDIAGAENEDLAEAARRELLEETGYEAKGMEFLADGPSSAGLTSEFVSFFRATGLAKVAEGGGDHSENIEVHEVPLATLEQWLAERRAAGRTVDNKVYSALYFVNRL